MVPIADQRFAFLAGKTKGSFARIRAMRLRGIFSMGLIVRPDADMTEGAEVRERMGIGIYEAPEVGGGGSYESGYPGRDPGCLPCYDIEGARKYHRLLAEGEEIVLTEKIHGANARFVHDGGEFWVGSRTTFKTRAGSRGSPGGSSRRRIKRGACHPFLAARWTPWCSRDTSAPS